MTVHLRAAVVLALLSAACNGTSPTASEVSVELAEDVLVPPAELQATLVNEGTEALFANLCMHTLERQVLGDWEAVVDESPAPCPTVLVPWPPHTSLSSSISIDFGLAIGVYRVRYFAVFENLEGQGSIEVLTPAFQIIAGQ